MQKSRLQISLDAMTQNGVKAPLKLIKNYLDKATPKPNVSSSVGGTAELGVIKPAKPKPMIDGTMGLMIPGMGQDSSQPGASALLENIPAQWNNSSTYCAHENFLAGFINRLQGSSVEDNNYTKDQDIAILFDYETVAAAKTRLNRNYVVDPINIVGGDFGDQTLILDALHGNAQVKQGTPAFVAGVYADGNVTGEIQDDNGLRGSITCTVNDTDEYDDWLVLKSVVMYTRKQGTSVARTVRNLAAYPQYPAVMCQMNTVSSVMQFKQQLNVLGFIHATTLLGYKDDITERRFYGYIPMPDPGVAFTVSPTASTAMSSGMQTSVMKYGVEGSGRGFPTNAGLTFRSTNHPWTPGYYNRIQWVPSVGSGTKGLFPWYAYGVPNLADPSHIYFGWMYTVGDPSPDYLEECYGAKNIFFAPTNSYTYNYPTGTGLIGNGLSGHSPIGRGLNNPASTGVWVPLAPLIDGSRQCIQRIAFPDEQHIKDFYADWGILATTDAAEAQNGDNNTLPDAPGGEGWGPWDPFSPPAEPWENPSNGNDGPPVDFDPNQPGVDPFDSDIPHLSPAIAVGGYVLSVGQLKQVQDWLCNGDFLKDSSNLFVDKMSAFNGATMFPFDIYAHDQEHCGFTGSLVMAGAPMTLECAKLEGSYNCFVDGGSLEFGVDWKALRPDFNAFVNSSYTITVPFVGNIEIPASAAIYRKITLKYAVDMLNGAGTAILYSYPAADYPAVDQGFLIGMYPCQVGQPIPFVSDNTTQRNFAITMGAISGALGGGSKGAENGKRAYNAMGGAGQAAEFDSAGFMTTKATAGAGAAGAAAGVGIALAGAAIGAAKGAFDAAISNPYEMTHAGAIGSLSAWSFGFRARLTVTSQIPATPYGYSYVMGSQTSQRGVLSRFSYNNYNYVESYALRLNISGATATELKLISDALQGGVFI